MSLAAVLKTRRHQDTFCGKNLRVAFIPGVERITFPHWSGLVDASNPLLSLYATILDKFVQHPLASTMSPQAPLSPRSHSTYYDPESGIKSRRSFPVLPRPKSPWC